jgi:hypothetical protein
VVQIEAPRISGWGLTRQFTVVDEHARPENREHFPA